MNENKKIKNRYNKSVENKISFISEIIKKTLYFFFLLISIFSNSIILVNTTIIYVSKHFKYTLVLII